jgi:hypothetical protein
MWREDWRQPRPIPALRQMIANQSLEKLSELLARQGNKNLPPAPLYTASSFQLAEGSFMETPQFRGRISLFGLSLVLLILILILPHLLRTRLRLGLRLGKNHPKKWNAPQSR